MKKVFKMCKFAYKNVFMYLKCVNSLDNYIFCYNDIGEEVDKEVTERKDIK